VIKINLNREGRAAVRGAGAAAPGGGAQATAAGPSNLNNLIVLALLGLGVFGSAGYWWIKSSQLSGRRDTIKVRQVEAQKLEAIIKEVDQYQKRKDSLENRITLINQLKQNQKGPVKLLDRISQDLPDLVWLDKMTLDAQTISVEGRALNPNAAGNFVENIKGDPLFEEPEFGGLTRQGVSSGVVIYSFPMSFTFKYVPPAPASDGAPAAAPGSASTTSPGAAGAKS